MSSVPCCRRYRQGHHQQPSSAGPSSMATFVALVLLAIASPGSAFFAPLSRCLPLTHSNGFVGSCPAAHKADASVVSGGLDPCHPGRHSRNINFVVRSGRESSALRMVVGSSEQEKVQGAGEEMGAGAGGYGMPVEASTELIRLEMAEVPVGWRGVRCEACG